MTNQPPPLDAEPTLDELIAYWRYVMGTDDMPRMLHPSHVYDRAILASLERLRATQRESGGELEKAARAIVGDGSIQMVCGEDITKAHVPLYQINALRAALSASQRKETP